MKLNILERIVVAGLLPKESDFGTLKVVREFKTKLSFSEKELTMLDYKIVNGSATWNIKGAKEIGEVKFDFPAVLEAHIINKLEDLNKKKKLNEDMISLYEKFVK